MPKKKCLITEYRNYQLTPEFPIFLLTGDHWKISDIKSPRLHFHSCLEIGICHSESGYMEFYDESYYFKAGDITIIPQNIPHTTYSLSGCLSKWSYLFLNINELLTSFGQMINRKMHHIILSHIIQCRGDRKRLRTRILLREYRHLLCVLTLFALYS